MDRVTQRFWRGVEGPVTFSIFRAFCIFNQLYSSPPTNRHPERSASQIDRVTQRFWRGVEGPRRCLITHAALSFSTTGAASVFPWSRERKEVPLTIQVRIAAESCCRVSMVEKLRAAWVN